MKDEFVSKRQKLNRLLIWVVIVAAHYLVFLPVPLPINKTVDAVELALDDKSFYEPMKVTISGTYYWRLFRDDTFKGDISFSGYEATVDSKLYGTLTLTDGSADLVYDVQGSFLGRMCFGRIVTKPFFNSFVVIVVEPDDNGWHWSTADGHAIVGVASSREKAMGVLKSIPHIELPPYEYWIE